jgi:REP element-mobilizing transposase RayT
MENKYATLEAEGYYHVFNRANGNEIIFRSTENYAFFLRQYLKYIHPFVDTFCYCLMPNHFHFLIQIKNQKALEDQQAVFKLF